MRKVNQISGALFVITGLLIAFGPKTIFSVCNSEGDMVMKCFYTSQAELGIGIEIAVLGLLLFIQKTKEAQLATAYAVGLSSIVAFLIPNFLIGVCGSEHMHCKAVTQPALTLISALTFIVSAAIVVLLGKENVVLFKREKVNA